MKYRTLEVKDKILELVSKMQPVTAKEVSKALKEIYGIPMSEEETWQHMEKMRSDFPIKLAHAGPDRYHLIDLR